MRTITMVFLALGVSAFPAAAQTFGARSAHHELKLQRNDATPVSYDVEVVDLDQNVSVLKMHVDASQDRRAELTADHGGDRIRVRIAGATNFLSAMTTVTRDATIVDEFQSSWLLVPRPIASMPTASSIQHLNAPNAYRVGGDVKAPIVVNRVEPVYPEDARREHISGIVIVEVLVSKDGTVKDAMVLKPLPDGLDTAALDAVRQWTFKPGTLNGEPVDVLFNLTINFKLNDAVTPPPE